jgi:hypothetical protein
VAEVPLCLPAASPLIKMKGITTRLGRGYFFINETGGGVVEITQVQPQYAIGTIVETYRFFSGYGLFDSAGNCASPFDTRCSDRFQS